MTNPIRCAASAALLLMLLCPGISALATEAEDRSRELFREFKEGLRTYNEGQYALGLAQMESAFAPLQAEETQRLDEFPETFSEKEARGFLMVTAFGGLHVWRKKLTEVYLDHGCFRQAKVLAERDLFLFDKVPEDFGEAPMRMSKVYRDVLYSLRSAARGLGQLEEAIEIQTRILAQDREFGRRPRFVASALWGLALLHQQSGNREMASALVNEARSVYQDIWLRTPPHELTRRSIEAQLLSAEGHYEEERRIRENQLALLLREEDVDSVNLIGAYTMLAEMYHDMGEGEKQRDALDKALPLLLSAETKESGYLVRMAHAAFQLLRKTGRATDAEKLAIKYKLCSE